jgi:hypothetical protein
MNTSMIPSEAENLITLSERSRVVD